MPKKLANGLEMIRVKGCDGKYHVVPKGCDLSMVGLRTGATPYKPQYLALLPRLYAEGLSHKEIAKKIGVKDSVLKAWIASHRDLGLKMRDARKLRGLFHEEKALEVAEKCKTTSTEHVQKARLQVETHKWAAEVSDPETYGKKTKLIGDPDQPVTFVVDTGIRRQEVPPQPQIEKKDES